MTTSPRVRAARELQAYLSHEPVDAGSQGGGAAVLDRVHVIAPSDGASLLAWNPAPGGYSITAALDYPVFIRRWLESRGHLSERFGAVRHSSVSPVRPRDIPWEPAILEEFARPCGFRDGFNLPLWSPDGRFVGSLIGSTVGASGVDDLAVDLLALLAPSLAATVDPVPRIRPRSADLADGSAEGMAVTRSGRAVGLTAGADTGLVRPSGPLWPLVRGVHDGRLRSSAATLVAGHRVLAVSIEAGERGTLVLHRTIPAPFGLSVREMEVLDGLAEGATNAALAARLAVTPRTIATYVERLLSKTGCPNRTAAARLAARLNLLVDAGAPGIRAVR